MDIETDRFYRRKEVERITGYSCSSLYRLMDEGQFPQGVKLGARAVAWRGSDLAQWAASRESLR